MVASRALTRPARGAGGAEPSLGCEARKEPVLRIYEDALVMLEKLTIEIANIERHDADLARQLRRASASVVLNIAEGSYVRGRNRKALYSVALGSAKEVRACLDVAKAFRYLAAIDGSIAAKLNVICGVLYRLTR